MSFLKHKLCFQCKTFGHRKDIYASDGTLPNEYPAVDIAEKFIEPLKTNCGSSNGSSSTSSWSRNKLRLNNACLIDNSCNHIEKSDKFVFNKGQFFIDLHQNRVLSYSFRKRFRYFLKIDLTVEKYFSYRLKESQLN